MPTRKSNASVLKTLGRQGLTGSQAQSLITNANLANQAFTAPFATPPAITPRVPNTGLSPTQTLVNNANLANQAFQAPITVTPGQPTITNQAIGPTNVNAQLLQDQRAMGATPQIPTGPAPVVQTAPPPAPPTPEATFDASGRQLTSAGTPLTPPPQPTVVPTVGQPAQTVADVAEPPPSELDIKFDGVIPSDAFGATSIGTRLQSLLEDNQKQSQALQEQLLAQMQPGLAEQQVEQQLAQTQLEISNLKNAAQGGIDLIAEQTIPLGFIVGQQAVVERRAQRALQGLQAQESNLLTRLGLEEKKRGRITEAISTALGFKQKQFENQFNIIGAIQEEEQNVFNRAKSLNEVALNTLATIVDNFVGVDFEQLDPNTQNQLALMGQKAGIPIDLIQAGMKVANDREMAEQAFEAVEQQLGLQKGELEIMKLQQDIENSTSGLEYELKLQKLRDAQSEANQKVEGTQEAANQAQSAIDLIQSLKTHKGLDGAVGFQIGTAFIPGTEPANFVAQLERLKAMLSLSQIDKLRGLGAMSNKEFSTLATSVAALSRTMSEDEFVNELGRIQESLRSTATGAVNVDGQAQIKQSINDILDANPNATDEEIEDMLRKQGLFNKEEQTSLKGTTALNIGNRTITVDKSISDKLEQANMAFKQATGKDIVISESFRTPERQKELFEQLSKKGARVAPPGMSFHEKGLAIDVVNWKEAEPFLHKLGFRNDLPDDRGHFSIGEFS